MIITGARQILESFPAGDIEPLNLPSHYAKNLSGYIVISSFKHSGVFDLVFLSESAVCGCVRMDNEFRSTQTLEAVRERLHDRRGVSFASLYEIPQTVMKMFLSTFSTYPLLTVPAHLLSAKQMECMLMQGKTEKGILEIDRLTNAPPSVELMEFTSIRELLMSAATVKEGHVLLYGLDSPKGCPVRQNDEADSPATGELCNCASSRPPGAAVYSACSKPMRNELERDCGREQPAGSVSLSPVSGQGCPDAAPEEVAASHLTTGAPPARWSPGWPPAPGRENEADYVRLLDHMFRGFRKEAHECFGRKVEGAITRAARQVRQTKPEFDLSRLSPATVLGVFDLLEKTLEMAPMLKRSKLRAATRRLLEDLYNANFEILEANGAVERLEELYYRLKK